MTTPEKDPRIAYIQETFSPEDETLQRIVKRIEKNTFPIQISPDIGRTLQLLIRMSGAKRIVEIGTLAGYSTIWMARALPDDGHIWTIECNPEHQEMALQGFAEAGVTDKITLMKGYATDMLAELSQNAPYDMIFIDADKISYESYLDWAEDNIRQGGLIVGDNTFLFGAVYMDELPGEVRESTKQAMLNFNRRLADPEKYTSVLLPTEQGLTVAVKSF